MNKLAIDSRLYSASGVATVADMARRYASAAFRKRKRVPASRARVRMSKRRRFAKSRPKRKMRKGAKNIQGKNVSVKNIGRALPRVYYPAVKATCGQIYEFNSSMNITSRQGRQAYDEISMGMCNNGTAFGNNGPSLLNANGSDLGNIFNNVFGVAAIYDTTRQGKILVRSISMTMYYTNQTDGYIHFTIYDILPRRDGDNLPLATALNGQRSLLDGNVTAGAEPLLNDEALQHVGVDLGSIPYFNQKYMIANRRTIVMSPGQVHRHTLNYKVNKVLNGSILDGNNAVLRGFTAFHVCRIHGFPADTATGDVTTLQSAKVCCVWRKRIKYHVIEKKDPTRFIFNNIEDDGVVLDNMNADGDIEVQNNA